MWRRRQPFRGTAGTPVAPVVRVGNKVFGDAKQGLCVLHSTVRVMDFAVVLVVPHVRASFRGRVKRVPRRGRRGPGSELTGLPRNEEPVVRMVTDSGRIQQG